EVGAGDVDEIERLLDDGASLGYVGKSYDSCLPPGPIHDISSGRYDLIPRQNRYPLQTPLIVALLSGQIEMVAILLHKGADVNQVVQDKNKHEGLSARALHYCRGTRQYSGNYLNTIKMLVEYGADVAAADADLRLISIAEFYNARWDIIDYLRSRGARIDGFDPKANGPQCLMGSISNTTSMRRLIGLGADVNGLTDMGVYPLSWAVSRNRVEVVRILLEAGAIPNQIDCRSLTPLAYTSKHKNSKMIDLLKSYGAK
ncbi:MAG TPA: hypothetical protein ENL03_04695, partial [Phycisphaerae bacterium]|nr:hypothetical protein [Phycisphaerae bacterium]